MSTTMNKEQKSLTELLRESEPPTAVEAAGLLTLSKALGLSMGVTDLVERYHVSRATHEQAAEEAKAAKTEAKELWETLQAYLNAGPDMFAGGGGK